MTPVAGIVVAHASLAAALVAATEKISGIRGALVAISNEGASPEDLLATVARAIDGRPAILFTDLGSGSCGFVCRSIGRVEADVAVVTGVNLPMLLDFVFHRDLPSVELAFRVAEKGRTDARAFPHEPERDVSGSVPD
ncbi:MAG: PTS mannose transporter subunit IID [Gemmatimonadota bacterium]